jgi:3-oxoacyl-[acyl-carrier-protein] synthase II
MRGETSMTERAGHRVVVTGLGAVSSLGIGVRSFTAAIRAGRTGVSPIRSFDTSGFPHTVAGEVHDFEPERLLTTLRVEDWGRSSLFAAAAGRLALEDARIDPDVVAAACTGSAIGTTSGESALIASLTETWVEKGPAEMDPRVVGKIPANRIAAAVNLELGLTGEAQTIATACAASNYALAYAYDMVRTGEADFMIGGGGESVSRWPHAGFYQLGALAESVCRPFDARRTGMLTGEGGVALFLETLDGAVARGARIYAEVLGYGVNCDAKHPVAPDASGIADCIRAAHRNAGVRPEDVDYICAHGTGTQANDATEIKAVREVFGENLPPISSIKSMIGHTLGAASGFGALACCMALYDGFLPPTANVTEIDPALGPGVDCVPGTGRTAAPRIVQNNGFAFGGNNAITVLGRVQ